MTADQRLGIEIIVIGLPLGNVVDIFNGKQSAVLHHVARKGMLGGQPVHGAANLAAVGGIAVSGLQIGCAVKLGQRAVFIVDRFVTAHDIRTHEAHLAAGLKAEELGGRILHIVGALHKQLPRERNTARTGIGILGIVGQIEIFGLSLGIVGHHKTDGINDRDAALCRLVQLLAQACLQKTDIHKAVRLGDAGALHEFKNGRGGIAAAAQTAQGGQTGIVPAVHKPFLDQFQKIPLAHHGIGHVQAGKFTLFGLFLEIDVIDDPLIQRTVVFKFQRTQRIGDALQRVLNGMCKVIQRINAPLVALTVMRHVQDAVNGGVAHVHIGGRHVDLGAQCAGAVRKFSVFHALEQVEIFLGRAIPIRRISAGFCQRSAVFAHFVGAQVAHIRIALTDQLTSKLIAFVKIVRAVEHAAVRHGAKPHKVAVDRLHVLIVLLGGVRVIIAQIKQTVVFHRRGIVDEDRLCRADVKISVRLGRKARVHRVVHTRRKIGIDNVVNKVCVFQAFVHWYHFSVLFVN